MQEARKKVAELEQKIKEEHEKEQNEERELLKRQEEAINFQNWKRVGNSKGKLSCYRYLLI